MKMKELAGDYPEQLLAVFRAFSIHDLDQQKKFAELADQHGVMVVHEINHLLSQKRVVSQRRGMIRRRVRQWLHTGEVTGPTESEVRSLVNSQGAVNRYKHTMYKIIRSER